MSSSFPILFPIINKFDSGKGGTPAGGSLFRAGLYCNSGHVHAKLFPMQKPVIGVTPLWDEEKSSLWMLPGYLEGITRAGALPLILPLTADEGAIQQLAGLCDGFLFTGGPDLAPGLYGAELSPHCEAVCKERDAMEGALFSAAVLKQGKSALGICRGIQAFNVFLGGTLIQDIPALFAQSTVSHRQAPLDEKPAHRVSIQEGTPLYQLLGTDSLAVNSSHHQAIKELSPELIPMARTEDGLIEAVCMKGRAFVWAVQWHPERALSETHSRKLFGRFVDACRES
jgi:putative glutamine amidotransferase